jgi:proteasome activator subunit 4
MTVVIAKMFEHEVLDDILKTIDPLLSDPDKFKQRAGGVFFFLLLRSCLSPNL